MPVLCFNETEGMNEQILLLRLLWGHAGVAVAPLKASIVARLISIRAPCSAGRCCSLAYQLFLLLLTMSDVFSSLGSCPRRREETAFPLGIPTWLPVSGGTE